MTTREVLANKIGKAFDIMRRDDGTTGILQYIEQASWMIFLKIFDDLEMESEAKCSISGEKYEWIIAQDYRWPNWTKKDWKGDELIDFINGNLIPYLRSLSGASERQLVSTIFNEIENRMRSPYNLKDVIEIFDQIDFNNTEDTHTLSQIYEDNLVLLGRQAGLAGEFYTPRPIVRAMVRIINPQVGDTVFDPFCGSCGFLVESYKHMRDSRELSVPELEFLQHQCLHGQEKKSLPYLIGIMNCMLHRILAPDLRRTNTLSENIRNISEKDRYTVILTNPPFGGVENQQIQQNFPIPNQSTELLALQYVMKKLKAGGRCGIVVPDSLLAGSGTFNDVKMELVRSLNVHTIISLPVGVFANASASGIGPKTSLLFFDKVGPTSEIWYYELTPPSGKKYSKANLVRDDDISDCIQKWKNKTISENSWVVKLSDVGSEFDFTAKNPYRKEEADKRTSKEIVTSIVEKEIIVKETLEEIRTLL